MCHPRRAFRYEGASRWRSSQTLGSASPAASSTTDGCRAPPAASSPSIADDGVAEAKISCTKVWEEAGTVGSPIIDTACPARSWRRSSLGRKYCRRSGIRKCGIWAGRSGGRVSGEY
ncbi:unnamed protein product [Musa acuminata subsp. burmannicoides]